MSEPAQNHDRPAPTVPECLLDPDTDGDSSIVVPFPPRPHDLPPRPTMLPAANTPTAAEAEAEDHDTPQRRQVGPTRPVLPDRPTVVARVKAAVTTTEPVTAAAFHLLRVPLYWWRLASRAPAGVAQAATWAGAYVAAAGLGIEDLDQVRARRRARAGHVATVCLATIAVLWVLYAAGLWFYTAALLALLAAGFGWLARTPRDTAILDRRADHVEIPVIDRPLIETALGSLGIAALRPTDTGITGLAFVAPIMRDGQGWLARIELPHGVTAGEVCERRSKLAAGLRRPLAAVWPEGDPDTHEAMLNLYVADDKFSTGAPVAWPLADTGTVDVFAPIPIGRSPQGRQVTVTLAYACAVIGAVPRVGKTFALRLMLLAAALDPRCELHLADLKGTGDLAALDAVAHTAIAGDEPDDMKKLMDALAYAHDEVRRRAKLLRSLGREHAPESKVTSALADRKDVGLHPVIVAVDECQILFEHPDHGKTAIALATDIAKRGPALGVWLWLATQRITASAIPRDISANAVIRLCLKVTNHTDNDMILGTGAYKSGFNAAALSRKDLGVAYLAGEGDDPRIVRLAYVGTEAAEAICARARTARIAEGRLTGYAAGEDPTSDGRDVLDHLAACWPEDEHALWCSSIADLLATTYPGIYSSWETRNVAPALRPFGIATTDIKTSGTVRKGIRHTDLTAAVTHRHHPEEGEPPTATDDNR